MYYSCYWASVLWKHELASTLQPVIVQFCGSLLDWWWLWYWVDTSTDELSNTNFPHSHWSENHSRQEENCCYHHSMKLKGYVSLHVNFLDNDTKWRVQSCTVRVNCSLFVLFCCLFVCLFVCRNLCSHSRWILQVWKRSRNSWRSQ